MWEHNQVMLGKEEHIWSHKTDTRLLCSLACNPAKYWVSSEPINFKRLKESSVMGRLQHFLRANHKLILKIMWVNFYRSFMLNSPGYHVCFSYRLTIFESNTSVYNIQVSYSMVGFLLLNFFMWSFCPVQMCRKPPSDVCLYEYFPN